MFSLTKFNLRELGYEDDIWSLWVDTEFGAIPVKVGTFKECWEERMRRYNRERGVYLG